MNAGSVSILGDANAPAVQVTFGSYGVTTDSEVEDSAFDENTVLKRAEWLKYYGAFFNAESTANTVFNTILTNYNNNKSLVTSSVKPVVAIMSYYNGSWLNQQTAYKIPLVADAGGVLANLAASYPNIISLFADLQSQNVSVFIDETYYPTQPSLSEVLATYNLTQTSAQNYTWAKNFYREDKLVSASYGLDWFDDGEIYGDAVLADFINIINPSLPFSSYQRVWLRNVYTQTPTVISGSDCANPIYKSTTSTVSSFSSGATRMTASVLATLLVIAAALF